MMCDDSNTTGITLDSGPLQPIATSPFSSSSDGYFSMISTFSSSGGTSESHGRS